MHYNEKIKTALPITVNFLLFAALKLIAENSKKSGQLRREPRFRNSPFAFDSRNGNAENFSRVFVCQTDEKFQLDDFRLLCIERGKTFKSVVKR